MCEAKVVDAKVGWQCVAILALSGIAAGRRATRHLSMRSSRVGRLAAVAGRSRDRTHQREGDSGWTSTLTLFRALVRPGGERLPNR